MTKIFSIIAGVLFASLATQAQDSSEAKSSKTVISGSADVYYRYNFNNLKDGKSNNLTSFTNSQNSFELGMASLKAEHSIGKVGMVADLGFGRRAEEFSYNDANTMFAIKQLYVTYAPSSAVKFTLGSWTTHVGYELVDAYMNRNYSMSYMFSYGPFFHTGVKADISLGGKSALMVGLADPFDLKSASNLPKMFIGQFSTGSKDGELKAYLNFQGGSYNDTSRLTQGDVVLTYAFSSKFNVGYNGTVQSRSGKLKNGDWGSSSSWWGSALYLNVDPCPWFGMTLRGEYFSDKKGVAGVETAIFAPTLSANFKIDNLTIIPELRLDNAKDPVFTTHSLGSTKTTGSFILAATYHF